MNNIDFIFIHSNNEYLMLWKYNLNKIINLSESCPELCDIYPKLIYIDQMAFTISKHDYIYIFILDTNNICHCVKIQVPEIVYNMKITLYKNIFKINMVDPVIFRCDTKNKPLMSGDMGRIMFDSVFNFNIIGHNNNKIGYEKFNISPYSLTNSSMMDYELKYYDKHNVIFDLNTQKINIDGRLGFIQNNMIVITNLLFDEIDSIVINEGGSMYFEKNDGIYYCPVKKTENLNCNIINLKRAKKIYDLIKNKVKLFKLFDNYFLCYVSINDDIIIEEIYTESKKNYGIIPGITHIIQSNDNILFCSTNKLYIIQNYIILDLSTITHIDYPFNILCINDNKINNFMWTPKTHRFLPPNMKERIVTLLICNKLMMQYKIPYWLIHIIINFIYL